VAPLGFRDSAARVFFIGVRPDTPRLFLLGGTELHGVLPTGADRLLTQSKTVALLAVLALSPPGRFQRRDRLIGLLWPDLDQQHARTALRKVVHSIRSELGAEALLARGDEELAIASDSLWCDASEFTSAAQSGRIARVVELYRGELLVGFHLAGCAEFGMWLDMERTAAAERASAAALAMSRQLESDDQLTLAGHWARRATHYVWSDERVLRRALTMLERVGDRAGALRLYEGFARRLRAELDADPSAETQEVVAAIRRAR
jgi:serine/threonine-protein kinase